MLDEPPPKDHDLYLEHSTDGSFLLRDEAAHVASELRPTNSFHVKTTASSAETFTRDRYAAAAKAPEAALCWPAFKAFVATGANDAEVATWIIEHSKVKDPTEVVVWNNKMRHTRPCDMPVELQVFLEGSIPKFIRKNRPVYVWFDVYDIEEQRI